MEFGAFVLTFECVREPRGEARQGPREQRTGGRGQSSSQTGSAFALLFS